MNTANVQIGDWLGVQPPATETEIFRIVEGRLAPSIINRLVDLGLEDLTHHPVVPCQCNCARAALAILSGPVFGRS